MMVQYVQRKDKTTQNNYQLYINHTFHPFLQRYSLFHSDSSLRSSSPSKTSSSSSHSGKQNLSPHPGSCSLIHKGRRRLDDITE
mmetsp:Transcript_2854/g.5872  ORF Transcript_2854/g.5872 Transcript_2854/m.5872 type:complete len:84 (+) Transcript_2854:697-948(+)